MTKMVWAPREAFNVISFDCDGTLTRIEGIDILADQNGVGPQVRQLTARAMSETGISAEMYKNRLLMVKPSRQQLIRLGQEYYYQRTSDASEVIKAFQSVGKLVYILSAGLNPALKIFGSLLGISEENIFGVNVSFDEAGNFKDYDHCAPTANLNGKHDIIQRLKNNNQKVAHVGDGVNDYEVNVVADRFIGYGGVELRENIFKLSDYYIKSASLLPLLPLCLTVNEATCLPSHFKSLYFEGNRMIERGDVGISEKIKLK